MRRHTRWLYSIDAGRLTGQGFAVTLTLRECPPDSAAWSALIRTYLKRLMRAGVRRVHWVVEWQRRGVPHLHLAIYWPDEAEGTAWSHMISPWLDVAALYEPSARSQDVKLIDGHVGWLQYLSKHASRGVKHYQRSGMPQGWDSTGRLWGHQGAWPEDLPMRFELTTHAGHRYRRIVRSWTIANARATGDPKRIAWARRMLRCTDPKLSTVRGVSGWVPEDVSLAVVGLLWTQGEGVIQLDEATGQEA